MTLGLAHHYHEPWPRTFGGGWGWLVARVLRDHVTLDDAVTADWVGRDSGLFRR